MTNNPRLYLQHERRMATNGSFTPARHPCGVTMYALYPHGYAAVVEVPDAGPSERIIGDDAADTYRQAAERVIARLDYYITRLTAERDQWATQQLMATMGVISPWPVPAERCGMNMLGITDPVEINS